MDVSDNTFRSWESGHRFGKDKRPARPNATNYDRLCELFPQLRSFPKPADLNEVGIAKKSTKEPKVNKKRAPESESVKLEHDTTPAPEQPVASEEVALPARDAASISTVEALSIAYGKALVAVVEAEKLVATRKAEAEAALEALRRGAYGTPEETENT